MHLYDKQIPAKSINHAQKPRNNRKCNVKGVATISYLFTTLSLDDLSCLYINDAGLEERTEDTIKKTPQRSPHSYNQSPSRIHAQLRRDVILLASRGANREKGTRSSTNDTRTHGTGDKTFDSDAAVSTAGYRT